MGDKIALISDGSGTIRWNINDGVLPPETLMPEGSVVSGTFVESPLKQDTDGQWKVFVGPFYKLGLVVDNLNVVFPDNSQTGKMYTVPVFSIETLAGKNFSAISGSDGFVFDFDGKDKKDFVVYSIVKKKNGCEINKIALDEKNRAQVTIEPLSTDTDEVTFMICALEGKKFTYEYSLKGSEPSEKSSVLGRKLGQALRLREVDASTGGLSVNVSASLHSIEDDLARMIADSPDALALFTRDLASILRTGTSRSLKAAAIKTKDTVFKKARFNVLEGNDSLSYKTGSSFEKGVSPELLPDNGSPKGDTVDDSHDNLGYLTFKKMEIVHGLTHLKIDPVFVEGQLLEIWTTLQISQGFPNLPIPDGLNIADFNEDTAVALLRQWSDDFHVGYEFPEEFSHVTKRVAPFTDDQERVKRVIQRMILSEAIVEYCYNSSLTMADDMAMCLYDFVKVILSSKSAIDDIAEHFEDVPIVGAVATKLKQKIHGKLVRIVQNVGTILSAKLPAPYNSIAPTVIQGLVWAYGKFLHVDIPGTSGNMLYETGAKLVAKYALTATPKIGYVSRGQVAIDKGLEKAQGLSDEGSLAQAHIRVWDDGNPDTLNSVREQVFERVNSVHTIVARNRKYADVARKISQIAQYTSLLDPTSISKVLAISAGVTSSGLLVHGGYTSGATFFELPVKMAVKGAVGAYVPVDGDSETERNELLTSPLDAATVKTLLRALTRSERAISMKAQHVYMCAFNKEDGNAFSDSFDELLNEDKLFDEILVSLEAIVFANSEMMKGDNEALEIHNRSQASQFERLQIMTQAFEGFEDSTRALLFNANNLRQTSSYVDYLRAKVEDILQRGSMRQVIAISSIERIGSGNDITVRAIVKNLSLHDLKDVSVTISSPLAVKVAGAKTIVTSIKGGSSVEVSWKLSASRDMAIEIPVFAVEAVADKVKSVAAYEQF